MQNSRATPKGLGKIGAYLSRLSPPNLLAGLIIFFSATQLGFHFWPLSSLVYGIRVDYLSPTIYFLDLLILLYLLFCNYFKSCLKFGAWNLVITLTPILLTNLLYSVNPLATLSWSLHFLLYLLFVSSLSPRSDLLRKSWLSAKMFSRTTKTSSETRSDLKGFIVSSLVLSLFFQLALSLSQVALGHSVGGLLYYVGERSVAVGQPAVALGSFMHEVVLRAYGTFGHPNVLAGWSVIVLLIFLRLRGSSSQARLPWFPTILTIFLVILTQSRAAALSLFGLVIPFYLLKNLKSRAIYFFVSLLVCWFVGPSLLSPTRSDLSRSERRTLRCVSQSVIRALPIFGSGAQTSISTYPSVSPENRLLQPDHNSFTLFLSWFGLFGVLAIIYYSKNCLRFGAWKLKFLLPLLPLLLFDHYLLTSPQGLFIFMVYLTVALNYSHVQNHRQ